MVSRHFDTKKTIRNHWSPSTGWYYELHIKISRRYNESRSCRKTCFYFSALRIEIHNKALQTVNKFITILIIFVQKALNRPYQCVLSLQLENSFRPLAATSKGIFELSPFGILVNGVFLTGRPVVRQVFKNNQMSNAHTFWI